MADAARMSIGTYLEARILDAVFNNTSLAITNTYAKLHTGDPGEDGTGNPAAETTRKVASFAAAAGGTCVTDADLDWTAVAAGETYTHVSFWDASTAGNHLWNGQLLAPYTVNLGDNLKLAAGQVTANLD